MKKITVEIIGKITEQDKDLFISRIDKCTSFSFRANEDRFVYTYCEIEE